MNHFVYCTACIFIEQLCANCTACMYNQISCVRHNVCVLYMPQIYSRVERIHILKYDFFTRNNWRYSLMIIRIDYDEIISLLLGSYTSER